MGGCYIYYTHITLALFLQIGKHWLRNSRWYSKWSARIFIQGVRSIYPFLAENFFLTIDIVYCTSKTQGVQSQNNLKIFPYDCPSKPVLWGQAICWNARQTTQLPCDKERNVRHFGCPEWSLSGEYVQGSIIITFVNFTQKASHLDLAEILEILCRERGTSYFLTLSASFIYYHSLKLTAEPPGWGRGGRRREKLGNAFGEEHPQIPGFFWSWWGLKFNSVS